MKKKINIILGTIFSFIIIFSMTSCDKECAHSWDSGEIVEEATCIYEGLIQYTCTKCNETKFETIKTS